MDTLIAQIYGSTESKFGYILITFPVTVECVKAATLTANRAAVI